MHRNGSGSTVSRHQILAEMPKHKVSMTSLNWQSSFQIQKGHALTEWYYVAGQWARLYVLEMTLLFCFFTEALHLAIKINCFIVEPG